MPPATNDPATRRNLLDLVDEVVDLSPQERRRHLDGSGLSLVDRRKVETWLGVEAESSLFLANAPSVIHDLISEDQALAGKIASSGAAPPPPSVSNYQIIGLIGRGAMGAIWKAHDTRLQRDVAIKVLAAPDVAVGDANSRILREARAAARLNHPNTVTIYQIIECDGQVLIVMEFLDGMSLADRTARNGTMPWQEALAAMRDGAAGLRAAHELGLIHRDIKPSNLMQTRRGTVKRF